MITTAHVAELLASYGGMNPDEAAEQAQREYPDGARMAVTPEGFTVTREPGDGPGDSRPDDEAAGHVHRWEVLAVQRHLPLAIIGKPVPHTIVLIRCAACGLPDSLSLIGEWTMQALRAASWGS